MEHLSTSAKDRDAVIQSLRAGVVPRAGQHLIQVGRTREMETLVTDIDRVADGGSAFRVVIGEYGAGKTFFPEPGPCRRRWRRSSSWPRRPEPRSAAACERRSGPFALRRADAQPRHPHQAGRRRTGRHRREVHRDREGGRQGQWCSRPRHVLRQKLDQLTDLVNGYDFADVIAAYCRGHDDGNEQLKSDAVRWLRGEFSTKTDARAALGVRSHRRRRRGLRPAQADGAIRAAGRLQRPAGGPG
jgi:hypothetical protein